jgi:hypothetical protein
MKREFAATIFSMLLAGTALAGPIEQSDLPPPAQNETPDSALLRGLIENTLKRNDQTPSVQPLAQDWDANSSVELWLNGIPESDGISLDALAARQERYPGYRPVENKNDKLPTAYTWQNGNWRANVGTNVTTASPKQTVIPDYLNPGAGDPSGGTGAINGRLEYDLSTWQFYGGTKRELVANPDGTLAVNNNFLGGTYYRLPSSTLDGKIGTGFEVNPVGDAKARLEYRQNFGANTEGFLAAERTTPFQHPAPDVTGNNGLKAGINRKF